LLTGSHRRTRWEWAALVLFALVVAYQIFVPPVVGLADNGDFEKVLGIFSLGAPADEQYKFVRLTYVFDTRYHSWREFISTEQALTGIAILLHAPFSKQGTFDIRFLGAVHAALYLGTFYLFQPLLRGLRRKAQVALYIVLMAVFGDVMYVSWFNSAYMDSSALIFLLLSAVLYVRALSWNRALDQIGFVMAAVLFTASKSAHCALGLPLAGLLLLSGSVFRSGIFRGVAAGLIGVSMIVTWKLVPADYSATGLYSVIFYELLPHSHDLGSDLQQLGLDDSYRRCVGAYAYLEGNPFQDPQFVREFAARASYIRLGLFLVRHPALAHRGIRYSLDFAGRQRPPMGNFAREAGLPPSAESHAFGLWSGLKRRIFENWGSAYAFHFLGICAGLCCTLRWRCRTLFPAGACLCLMGLMALGIASFGDAVEVTRHFFLFNALADIILICTLAAVCRPAEQLAPR
jgi:hypothetical protein